MWGLEPCSRYLAYCRVMCVGEDLIEEVAVCCCSQEVGLMGILRALCGRRIGVVDEGDRRDLGGEWAA